MMLRGLPHFVAQTPACSRMQCFGLRAKLVVCVVNDQKIGARLTMRILAVCLGNICRSPTAEAVLRANLPSVDVDSAGTGAWHVGDPPYPPAIKAAAERGYDLTTLRARQVTEQDFHEFDLILAMDAANLRHLKDMCPRGATASVKLLMDYAPDVAVSEVPDPYYTGDFEGALDLIEAAAEGLRTSSSKQDGQ